MSDVSTSDDDDHDEEEENSEVNKTPATSECKETSPACEEVKEEVNQEQQQTQEKKTEESISNDVTTTSQPAVFIPVDRSPKMQVCQ